MAKVERSRNRNVDAASGNQVLSRAPTKGQAPDRSTFVPSTYFSFLFGGVTFFVPFLQPEMVLAASMLGLAGPASAGSRMRLMTSCWAMVKTPLVNEYSDNAHGNR